jgi:flagellar basal body-associated protein FliL
MAETEEKKQNPEPEKEEQKNEKGAKKSSGGILQWIILVVVVIGCAGAGIGLGKLFAGSDVPLPADSNAVESSNKEGKPKEVKKQAKEGKETKKTGAKKEEKKHGGGKEEKKKETSGEPKIWYQDLDPVVANLNEPGVTRYIRVTLTLEMNPEFEEEAGREFIEEKKPVLTDWLSIYLAGLTIDDSRGDKNLKMIQAQILDAFNERLFPDSKPQIHRILFKEFAIQ